jgi:TRAP-type C4-dicarboxylate transport system substrate-binding protein
VTAVLASLAATTSEARENLPEFRVGSIAPEGTAWVTDCIAPIREALEKAEPGRVRTRFAYGAMLGDERTQLELVQRGRLSAYTGGLGALATLVPELNAFLLPFLFDSEEEVDAVLRSPALEDARKIARGHGFELVGMAEVGWRSFGGKQAFRRPADFAGVAARSQDTPIQLEMWRRLGARPKLLQVTEVLSALEAGLVQAVEQSPIFLFSTSWYHHTPQYTMTRHMYEPGIFVVSRKLLAGYPASVERALRGFRPVIEGRCTKSVRLEGKSVLRELAREGVTLVELTAEERGELRTRLMPVREVFRKTTTAAGRGLLTKIEAALAAHRGHR